MLSKKKGGTSPLLVKRPEPPSFDDIIRDISSAADNDVVFSFSSYTLLSGITLTFYNQYV